MNSKIFYDLHIHSCLSGCADDNMTPANIAGFARLEGVHLISVTDHNSAANLPAVQKACREYGVRFIPGIEVTSAEEIHLLCYFRELAAALAMDAVLQKALPAYPYNRDIFGNQLIVDEEDRVLAENIRPMSAAVSLNMYEVKRQTEVLGGLCVPAHINRQANSLLAVLGLVPSDFICPAYEWSRLGHAFPLSSNEILPKTSEILYSSDAHTLTDIGSCKSLLTENSIFSTWIDI